MLTKFSTFTASAVCLFCNKTNSNSKTLRCNKARILYNTPKKTHLRESLLLVLILFFVVLGKRGWSRGGRIFEAGCLLTSSAFRMGGFSKWALIGWALIQINTVISIFSDKNLVPE